MDREGIQEDASISTAHSLFAMDTMYIASLFLDYCIMLETAYKLQYILIRFNPYFGLMYHFVLFYQGRD